MNSTFSNGSYCLLMTRHLYVVCSWDVEIAGLVGDHPRVVGVNISNSP